MENSWRFFQQTATWIDVKIFMALRHEFWEYSGVLEKCKKVDHKIVIIFLSKSQNMCFVCSKEPSH